MYVGVDLQASGCARHTHTDTHTHAHTHTHARAHMQAHTCTQTHTRIHTHTTQGWMASLLAKASPHVPPVSVAAESGLSGLEGLGVHAGMTKEQVCERMGVGVCTCACACLDVGVSVGGLGVGRGCARVCVCVNWGVGVGVSVGGHWGGDALCVGVMRKHVLPRLVHALVALLIFI
jgi:hypothetical protein